MLRTVLVALVAGALSAGLSAEPAAAGWRERYEVYGVKNDDMLKMRAGPGIGYIVIVGLPNGAVVRVNSCQLIGGTRWCKVSLEQAPALKGYVSSSYLREK
ncbi:MAG: SH3 domain-containing protein [Cypionkella sp.]|uniref:SH3 domain-containing protein n=1 Tax=Cypionkella sp. TaxID=2811411 RepID=UPI002ABC0140|nr:SH3 domain-containing protein [Cypionkella sp.]MDZ4312739.1 SH3 domain-containing protein [Cypionkella sp.]MDZ4395067.1 SH3 domain-containing protein [Cypionkella sp.]